MSKKPKIHSGVVVEMCPRHGIHAFPHEVEHEDDEPCPVHVCDEDVYTSPDYEKATNSVGYNPTYSKNYSKLDWSN